MTVQKTTLPAGDTTSFSILASGSGTITSDGAGSITDASDKVYEVTPGTYSVAETVPSDWTKTGDTCQNVTVAAGESKTCLITNTKNGSITIEKQVVGTDKSFTFTGSIAASLADNQTATLVVAPGSYSVTEGADAAYALTSLVCSDNDSTGNTNTRTASFVVAAGENVTCVFTNSQLPKLTLVKTVTNDNGGGAVTTDFQGKINGNNVPWASAQTLTPGSFTASETNLPNYSASSWGGDCAANGTITLAYGDNKTCTINNNDNAPALILVKQVINDNGGTAVGGAWTLTATGYDAASPDAGTYNLSESGGPAGYTQTSLTCSDSGSTQVTSVTLGLGEQVTCTFVNDDNAPSLTLVKEVVNDNGGTAVAADFTLTAAGYDAASPDAGTYNLSESGPAGYTQTSLTCSDSGSAQVTSVTLGLGEQVTCTFVNNDNAPKLHLRKIVTNDNGGSATVADFTLTADGATTNDISGTSPVDSTGSLKADTFALSETNVSGYTASAWSCVGGSQNGANITLALGEEATCTITNDDQQSYVIVDKTVVNNNGGSAAANDFLLTVNGNAVSDAVAYPVNPGTHTAGETNLPGYTAGAWGGDCGTDAKVTVALGQTKTCTITNDDQQAYIIVDKTVVNDDGGTAAPNDFLLKVDSNGVMDEVAYAVNPGTHKASETLLTGYTASEWGGACDADGDVSVALGETKTCTITNADNTPTLKLVKTVMIDNGGDEVADDWTLTAVASSPKEGRNISTLGGSDDFSPVFAGASYTLGETGPGGYTASDWSCEGGSLQGSTLTVALGEQVICTIVNNDIAPSITLIKEVVTNNGGTADPDDFGLTIGTASAVSGTTYEVAANTAIALNETSLAGYTFVDITGDAKCPAVLGGSVTLDEDEDITCTIKNDDIPAHLIVIKQVDNGTTGATTQASAFTTTITGVTTANQSTAGVASPGIDNVLTTVGAYSVDEGDHTGYDKTLSADCSGTIALGETKTCTITNTAIAPKLTLIKTVTNDNGGTKQVADFQLLIDSTTITSGVANMTTIGGHTASEVADPTYTASNWGEDCAADGSVTLALGETKTCTITNDDKAPKLTLVKVVTNDNGGTAVAANWTLTAAGYSTQSPQTGTYTLSETNGPAGYTQTSLTCSNSGTNQVTAVTLGLGDDVTCTFVNDDNAPSLTLVKQVTNNNGGTAVANDWTLSAAGYSTQSPQTGTYALSETGPAGYTQTSLTCSNTGDTQVTSATLALGEYVTCTFVNNDNAPSLTLNKIVVNNNGGTAAESAWTLTATGALGTPTNLSGAGAAGSADVVSGATFKADTYTLAETGGQTGYTASAWSCTNGVVVTNNQITLGLGQSTVCSITNDDQPGRLIVIKHVINDNGDMAAASHFIMHLTGTNLSQNDFAGSETGVTVTLNAGAYTADEINNAGYTKTLSAECSGTIAVGQTKTCTITNNDRASATRTQGFWKTHTTYTTQVLGTNTFTIGSHAINSPAKLFAGFYTSLSKTSAGGKRSALDQARMQLLQQWLAAKLNCTAFGCSTTTQTLLNNAATAFAGTNQTLIKSYATQLDAYNNSNDALPISAQGKATPQTSQSTASSQLSFWNTLP